MKKDPELIEHLAPTKPPFPFGTKRPSLEQRFYEVFNQDNVKLVGLKKNPIDEVLPHGVGLADGTVLELDALILATGFDAVTGSFSRVNIKGLKNKLLNQEWGAGSRTFLGIATSGFPKHALHVRPAESRGVGRGARDIRDPVRLDHPDAPPHAAAPLLEDRGPAGRREDDVATVG